MDKNNLYVHEITLACSSIKIEDQVCKILAGIYLDRQRGLEKYEDPKHEFPSIKDVKVKIGERRLSFRCHNGWTYTGKRKSTVLGPPNKLGLYIADGSVILPDFIPHDNVAVVVELEFKAHVMGDDDRETSVSMGYNIFMPILNNRQIMKQTTNIKLNKGPGQNID